MRLELAKTYCMKNLNYGGTRYYSYPHKMPEVQRHGFIWQDELIHNVYRATDSEIESITYTSKMDLPSEMNHLDGTDLSIKVSCSANSVCMADALRIYDAVSVTPHHMTVIVYTQNSANTKKIMTITEVDLSNSVNALFGDITRAELEELDKAVKAVPQKRSPTAAERTAMYSIRDKLQLRCGAIHLDIKCNSQQSRLQCSFNRLVKFLEDYPLRIVAQGKCGEFRGGHITEEIASGRRTFAAK